jgi:hypothetical protein
MRKGNLVSIKKAAALLGMSKKDIKSLMVERQWITTSLAVQEEYADGCVAEISMYYNGGEFCSTSLYLTMRGMQALIADHFMLGNDGEEVSHG